MMSDTLLTSAEMETELNIGTRSDFELIEFSNPSGLTISFYENGGTRRVSLNDIMVNQVEGHPFDGGMDCVYIRRYAEEEIESHPVSGTSGTVSVHKNGMRWAGRAGHLDFSMETVLHPKLSILYRVCHATNSGTKTEMVDWMAGQDLGLAEAGALKNNEAYVCQYLDHKIAVHPLAGKTIFSRNNLMIPNHPFAASFCLQGARSASTDGYQFFGLSSKMDYKAAALHFQTLEDRVRQYEFAYAALQSQKIQLQPCQSSTTVFAIYILEEHAEVSSASDLGLVDEVLTYDIPEIGPEIRTLNGSAFFSQADLMQVLPMDKEELEALFGSDWRHVEKSDRNELYSFFCGEDTHVVLPAKEVAVERQHGTILKSEHGAELDENVLSVSCYGFGAFGSQLSLGNTSFGRFTTIMRNSLNRERSSGIRIFVSDSNGWEQLGFPSVLVMERDVVRWIYKTPAYSFAVEAHALSESIEYRAVALSGGMPALRMILELCGDVNEFDARPVVTWNKAEQTLTVNPAESSLLKSRFPESCLLMTVDYGTVEIGDARVLGGTAEPYAVMDFPGGEFIVSITGHYDGPVAAAERLKKTAEPDWGQLMSGFLLHSPCDITARLSDTVKWYAHNAMIHFAAPRGMEQYGGAAWGTRDVCQGPLEFLMALGHDKVAADMLVEVFRHQYADSGTWPQWFMFDGFHEVQQHDSHGDIVYWPVKALCDYIEQSGDFRILDIEIPYTDPEGFRFTEGRFPLIHHLRKAVQHIRENCVSGTALPSYGNGDWNDSLQPANQEMKTHMVSGWTVGLAYQTLSSLSKVCKAAGYSEWAEDLDEFRAAMYNDFQQHVIEEGVAAGFVLFGDEETTHMLHPSDADGIKCRLLPINRSIISELFTPEEADFHITLAERYLKFPDGMRLMDRPPEYSGGKMVRFQRAETASHFGREIGLQYVHAHIRWCEAMAKVGRAEELLDGLLVISPVAINATVPNARPRQANLYFSSSDAEVYDRYEASRSMDHLKKGNVGALGGWRLYSSGPGIYIGQVISRLFGIRRSFGRIEIDPVLPKSLDGAELDLELNGKPVKWIYRVKKRSCRPESVSVNGEKITDFQWLENPYREGGMSIDARLFDDLLQEGGNCVEIVL